MKFLYLMSVSLLVFAISTAAVAADQYVINVANSLSPEEPTNKAVEYFKKEVEKRTNGQVKIRVFPAEQLGSEKDVNAMVQNGASVISVTSAGYLSDFVPEIGIMSGPYMFDSVQAHSKVVNSDWFGSIQRKLNNSGLKLIVKNQLFGYRNIISNKPIREPADIKGISMRVPKNTVYIDTFKALGARPTTVPWSETYNALQQGVVDAAEAPLSSILGSKLYETKDILSLTHHFMAYNYWIINYNYFSKLPDNIQKILLDVGKKAGAFATKLTLDARRKNLEKFRDNGVTVIKNVDREAFRSKAKNVYQAYPGWSEELYNRIQEIMGK